MKKKLSYIFVPFWFVVAGCVSVGTEDLPSEELLYPIEFTLQGNPITRAVGTESEDAVTSFNVMVFSGTKVYAVCSGTSGAMTNLPAGTYDCYAFVNCTEPWMSDFSTTKADIASKTSSLSDNTVSKFVMSGSKTVTIDATEASHSVPISVYRHVSKVEIDKVSINFDGTFWNGQSLKVNRIYLTNVCGKTRYATSDADASPAPSTVSAGGTWYNKLSYVSSSAVNPLLCESLSPAVTIADNNSTASSFTHCFYCCPNASGVTAAFDSWPSSGGVPCTRLVLECTLDGKTTYYHIDIPSMKPNTLYKVSELVIKSKGGENPEHYDLKYDVSFTVSVEDWATGFTRTYTVDSNGMSYK